MTILERGEHAAEHLEELRAAHARTYHTQILFALAGPTEAQTLLLIVQKTIVLIYHAPQSLHICLRRLIVLIHPTLATGKGQQECQKSHATTYLHHFLRFKVWKWRT